MKNKPIINMFGKNLYLSTEKEGYSKISEIKEITIRGRNVCLQCISEANLQSGFVSQVYDDDGLSGIELSCEPL